MNLSRITSPIILLTLALTIISCKKKSAGESVEFVSGAIEKTSRDFVIPRALTEQIEKNYLAYIRKNNSKVVLSDEEVLSRIPRDFLDVKFQFRSSAPKVLSHHTEFSLPRGGGEIDLSKYVVGEKGSFYLTTEVNRSDKPHEEINNLDVYFLSNAKKRKLGSESFGSGCKTYMDISKLLANANASGGLQLNATQQRYLSLIGGVFYFVHFDPERKIYIAAVRVTDTRYPEIMCDEAQ